MTYWRMAASPRGFQLKSGLAPTGVLRQKPVHSSSQSLNIRPEVGKRQTRSAALNGFSLLTLAITSGRISLAKDSSARLNSMPQGQSRRPR